MTDRIALKRLTASDLTLFAWQFKSRNAGNQKSINLNANVIVDMLFPALPDVARSLANRIPIDLHIFGPGMHGDHNIQRKIIRGVSYKNWRLNGEFIANPPDALERYNVLKAGDFAVLDFQGDVWPTGLTMLLVAESDPHDVGIHRAISVLMAPNQRMRAARRAELAEVLGTAEVPPLHPIGALLPDTDVEEAALGDGAAAQRVWQRRTSRPVSPAEVLRLRMQANDTGNMGEELVNLMLDQRQSANEITQYEWISQVNAVAPYDFSVSLPDGSSLRVEVKSTISPFGQRLHLSMAELLEAAHGDVPYSIWRLSGVGGDSTMLHILDDFRPVALEILNCMGDLPSWVRPDGFSISPAGIPFGPGQEVRIDHDGDDDE